ncbi:MAG: LysM peptidoglycan-binding domain-containing protein [Actinomycetota bacterium]|nr:LysM peptidoglycan-binding domain-containing protein [Actinomycetota bacterium]
MSAALAWDVAPADVAFADVGPVEAFAGDGQPTWTGRPVLRLVPTGPQAGSATASARPGVRLSRLGRLVLTLAAVALLAALAGTLFGVGAADATIDHRVVVHSGQTLSQIAAVELPQLSVAEGVAQIQLANRMNTSQVHAGQELAIPTVG